MRAWIALFAFTLSCAPPPAAPRAAAPEEDWSAVERAAEAAVAEQKLVGLGVGVAHRGRIVVLKGFGFEDREAKIPVDPAVTRFRWASVSKTVTGVLTAQLAREGALALDAPIQTYLPSYVPPSVWFDGQVEHPLADGERLVTARRLGAHLAGIPHYENGRGTPEPPPELLADPSRNTGMESALPFLVDKPLIAPAGARYEYSTFGFNLLGVVLEKAAKKAFAELVQTRINARAGTAIVLDVEAAHLPRRAVGYARGPLGDVTREGSTDVAWKAAGGGLISSTEDFTRYCGALLGDSLLTPEDKALAWTPAAPKSTYGLGFDIGTRGGDRRIAHTGAQEKTRTTMAVYPERGLCVVAMTNSTWADTRALGAALEVAALASPAATRRGEVSGR